MKTISESKAVYRKICSFNIYIKNERNVNKFLNQITRKNKPREHKRRNDKNRIRWLENFPGGSVGKESTCNAGDMGLIPGSGRSLGERNDNPLQYSSLGNPMDREAWLATVHGVARVGHDLVTKPPGE